MKLAVLADIHGNYAALQAVAAHIDQWRPDAVVVAGDIVNRGPRSPECLRFVRERAAAAGWRLIRGNHDEYVIRVAGGSTARPGLEGAVWENVRWTAEQLGDVATLEAMPVRVSLVAPDGGEVRVVHASMRHNRDNILPDTPDAVLREQIAPAPPLFCVGHTHRPLVRAIDTTLVINAGSVGLPFDGDVRASYAQLHWQHGGWHAAITRVPYDREQTARDYVETGFLRDSGVIAELIFDEFRTARSRLDRWMERYRAPVLAGEISAADTVHDYLAQLAPEGEAYGDQPGSRAPA
jgi:putative phosphoesterase